MASGNGFETGAGLLKECQALFDWWERFASSLPGTGLMFTWAFAEAIAWPIIPDFLLVLMVAGNRQRFYVPLTAAIVGSALGGIAIFLFAYWAPDQALHYLQHLPLIRDAQIQTAARRLEDHGAVALLLQPWSGTAFKVWGVMAGFQSMEPWLVIPAFIIARAVRMALWAMLVRVAVGLFADFFRNFSIFILIAYLVLFFYGWWQVTL